VFRGRLSWKRCSEIDEKIPCRGRGGSVGSVISDRFLVESGSPTDGKRGACCNAETGWENPAWNAVFAGFLGKQNQSTRGK
jgi:hypothetical protein